MFRDRHLASTAPTRHPGESRDPPFRRHPVRPVSVWLPRLPPCLTASRPRTQMPAFGQERSGSIMGSYQRPIDLDQGLQALAAGSLTIVAGGTDYYPARVERPLAEDVLDISGLTALNGIAEAGDELRIGAGVTWSELIATRLPRCFDGLKQAAREVGGRQ